LIQADPYLRGSITILGIEVMQTPSETLSRLRQRLQLQSMSTEDVQNSSLLASLVVAADSVVGASTPTYADTYTSGMYDPQVNASYGPYMADVGYGYDPYGGDLMDADYGDMGYGDDFAYMQRPATLSGYKLMTPGYPPMTMTPSMRYMGPNRALKKW
jgi:hypothetical protein